MEPGDQSFEILMKNVLLSCRISSSSSAFPSYISGVHQGSPFLGEIFAYVTVF